MQSEDDAVSKGRLISQWVQKMKAGEITQAELIDIMRKQVASKPSHSGQSVPQQQSQPPSESRGHSGIAVDLQARQPIPSPPGQQVGLLDPEEDEAPQRTSAPAARLTPAEAERKTMI